MSVNKDKIPLQLEMGVLTTLTPCKQEEVSTAQTPVHMYIPSYHDMTLLSLERKKEPA